MKKVQSSPRAHELIILKKNLNRNYLEYPFSSYGPVHFSDQQWYRGAMKN